MGTDDSNSFLKRVTLKLSTDLSNEEIRMAIANAMGIPIEIVPQINFPAAKTKIREESQRVNAIVAEYKLKLQSIRGIRADKFEELHDIGRFILAYDQNIALITPQIIPKFPDFKVKRGNDIIAIEHTRLIREETKASIKTARYLIKKANERIADQYNYLSRTVNIFIDYGVEVINGKSFKTRKFSPLEKDTIITTIVEYVIGIVKNEEVSKPSFVQQVTVSSNKDSRIDLELAENYLTQNEFSEFLLDRIISKEKKAASYRNNRDFTALWLVVIADDLNSYSGFDISQSTFPWISKSNFDKLILFEKFGGKVHILYSKSVEET